MVMDTRTKGALFVVLLYIVNVHGYGCLDGWRSHGQSCYVFMREMYNWFNAKEACEAVNAHLVEIESTEENDYLGGLIQSYGASQAWIGLDDFVEEGTFVWVTTSEPPEQTFWAPQEPDDRYAGEDCAAMTKDGAWFDGQCENTHRNFICETPAESDNVIG